MNKRIEKFKQLMHRNNIHNFIITNPFNLNYFANFHGLDGDGCMVITDNEQVLITDSRYELEMQDKLPNDVKLKITRDYYGTAATYLKNTAYEIGFEDSLSFQIYQTLNKLLPNRLVSKTNLVEILRDTKDENEISILEHSAKLASQAYEAMLQYVHAGLTEREVSLFLYDFMLRHGAQKPSFDTIVASGYRSALPHGDATDKKIENGELVTVDFGFYYQDYTSDMTRTFAVGDPGQELKDAYQVVLDAQNKMIDAMTDSADGKEVDAAARDYITDKGYGEYFGHGSGHSIGLDIHETPILGSNTKDKIYENYVMTAEPGIYLPGKGGIRIEDDVLVQKNGHKVLTTAPKEIIIL
ncbi:Xaa-Pro peptidase family protein [Apilactobacillus apisilvae]|uniref:Xaa-Pro peptidase family protein n=1 Tax=Apilactobacillus apisilvae TaxID=2923364 RepID=A0ABY4PG21_9LACO|nr:Xaa-Pro peptidase family protein [Apilactobacillus apisilvae]UQS84746.1 Xaa-Pro peptidase family protein [Apilactobacillus apisilvae]